MKDYGSKHPVARLLPDRATVVAVIVLALLILAGETIFLLGLDRVAGNSARYSGATSPYWANQIILAEVEQ